MKRFIVKNPGFVCEICSEKNPAAPKTCRNHCRKCLHSKHVDRNPGDRAETCHGSLVPVEVLVRRGSFSSLVFRCEKCGAFRQNKVAEDDSSSALLRIWSRKSASN